ncbi:imidazole glycerol phosphate synthase subunit HisH [Gemmatimonadota bacterium]
MTGLTEVIVVRTGTANLASIEAGLLRVGARPRLSNDPDEVASADRVVLPGVGAFAAAVGELSDHDLVGVLRDRIEALRPTLAICLGMQLLGEGSEESPGIPGIGAIPAVASRFTEQVKVPQLGWNRVEPESECRYLVPGFAYFANSYRLTGSPDGWSAATTDYDGKFVSALERGPVMACQFHPELSGTWGLNLLRRWLEDTSSPGVEGGC